MNTPHNLRDQTADATISECPQRWPKPSEMSLAHSKDKPDATPMPASIGVRFAAPSPFEPALRWSAPAAQPPPLQNGSALDAVKRKFWLVVASSLALLTLAGCGQTAQPTPPTTTNTASGQPAVPPAPSGDTNGLTPMNSANTNAAASKP